MTRRTRRAGGIAQVRPALLLSVLSLQIAVIVGWLIPGADDSFADVLLRWRYSVDGGHGRGGNGVVLVAIEESALRRYGLYGRGQWLTRKPYVDLMTSFLGGFKPSCLAFDIQFHETLGEQDRELGMAVSDAPARLGAIRDRVEALATEGHDFESTSVLNDMARLTAEQGDLLFRHALNQDAAISLDGSEEERGFPVLLAYELRGGWVSPQEIAVAGWNDREVHGEDPAGDEEMGDEIPYLLDMALPDEWVGDPPPGYGYSPNANMPANRLLDCGGIGFVNVPRDADGVVRRVPLVAGLVYTNSVTGRTDRKFVPSFALATSMMHLGMEFPLDASVEPGAVQVEWGREIVLRPPGHEPVHIPVDEFGRLRANFYSRFNDFPVLDFAQVGDAGLRKANEVLLEDKAVMVGVSVTGVDTGPCPIDPNTPLMLAHATVLDNILTGSFLRSLKKMECVLLYATLFAMFAATCAAERTWKLVPATVLLLALYTAAAYACVHFDLVLLPVVTPFLFVALSSFSVMAYRYVSEERGRRRIRGMFSTMVSPEVLAYLEENPESFSLAGHNAEATVFFSDIADFTSLSEGLPPARLTEFLNSYLTPMTDCLMEHGGYVDKFVGDLIMGVWGAPVPVDRHAERACNAALEQQRLIKELNPAWKREYGFGISARMGVNTGMVAAGSMGSARKLQYTVMGDVVNLGARLEPANRDYGTGILIGPATYRMVKDTMFTRHLDRIVVKGKTEVVPIYELVSRKGEETAGQRELVERFEQAMERYYARDWDAAGRVMEKLATEHDDLPAQTIFRRIALYRENPPGPEWRGEVFRAGKY